MKTAKARQWRIMMRAKNWILVLALSLIPLACVSNQQKAMGATHKERFGTLPTGEQIDVYRLENSKGVEVAITNYGGRIVSLRTPDRNGKSDNIVLGFENLDGYLGPNPYFGAIVGRYANRIAKGEFTLDGVAHKLVVNNGPNALHGGTKGFDKVAWTAKEVSTKEGPGLELQYLSKDGEEGYPGNLSVTVTYVLTDATELKIDYKATTDKDTVLNLSNHSYFDLSGQAHGDIVHHIVTINADRFTPVDETLIPTGQLQNVQGTPFDFRKPKEIAARIDDKDQQLGYGKGYDHNFVLNRTGTGPTFAARVRDPKSGRVLEVLTTQPGLQFYTGNHLDGTVKGDGGVVYGFRSGLCLETQHFPDSPNKPKFPTTELRPGQHYHEITIFKFSTD